MSWRCDVSNFGSLGCQEGHQRQPYPLSLEMVFLEDSWFLTHFLDVGYFPEISCFKFQISRMSGRSSKSPLSSISWVGSLEDSWFLKNFLDVGYVLEMVLFKSQVCSSLCGVIFMWYHSEKFIGHMRIYGGMKQLQSLLKSRPPESESEIEFEMTWRSFRVDLDLVWTRVWQFYRIERKYFANLFIERRLNYDSLKEKDPRTVNHFRN